MFGQNARLPPKCPWFGFVLETRDGHRIHSYNCVSRDYIRPHVMIFLKFLTCEYFCKGELWPWSPSIAFRLPFSPPTPPSTPLPTSTSLTTSSTTFAALSFSNPPLWSGCHTHNLTMAKHIEQKSLLSHCSGLSRQRVNSKGWRKQEVPEVFWRRPAAVVASSRRQAGA